MTSEKIINNLKEKGYIVIVGSNVNDLKTRAADIRKNWMHKNIKYAIVANMVNLEDQDEKINEVINCFSQLGLRFKIKLVVNNGKSGKVQDKNQ